MWHPARMGFNLFTLIVKFNIRDNAHPLSRSWNSSSGARIDSMTCCSYSHSCISVHLVVLCNYALVSSLSFIVNSPLNAMFTFTLPCFSTASRTHSRTTLPASSKNRRGSKWLMFIISPVNTQLSNASLVRQEIFRCYSRTRHQCVQNIAPTATLHPQVARSSPPRIVSVQWRDADAWHNKNDSSNRSMHSSHRCSHAKHFTKVAIWPHCSSNSRFTRSWFSTTMSFHNL